jgi:hypothetical protein
MTSWSRYVAVAALLATTSLASASTNVLMMRDRPALVNTPVVVWGNTSFPDGTYTIDFGDTTAPATGTVTDPSFIAATHTYTASGTFTARLTVTSMSAMTDSETAVITVSDPATTNAFDLRQAKIDMAIEDGLRWLYVNRTDQTSPPTTSWSLSGSTFAGTSLVALAFQNHSHLVTNDPTKDIYQRVIQRALNFIFDEVSTQSLTLQPTGLNPLGNDPCVGPGIEAAPCMGLAAGTGFLSGYETSIATFAVAAATAGAPGRVVEAGLGSQNANFVAGKTYAEILQRMVNAVAWGQNDGNGGGGSDLVAAAAALSCDEGGFQYTLNVGSDGSAIGWAVLSLFDGQAAGATVPPWVAVELANVIAQTSCTMNAGEVALSYTSCYMPGESCCSSPGNCDGSLNVAKTGVLLQALNYMGVPVTDPRVQGALSYISTRWEMNPDYGFFKCHNGEIDNKGCGYGMFNAFKGLKLYGQDTLPGVTRPAGPGSFPANDWYEDYRDFLVAGQSMPNDPAGGNWENPTMDFSSQTGDSVGSTALAEIILSATALIPPSQLTLSPETATNPVKTSHTVTATATSASGSPVPGARVTFKVLSGPGAGTPEGRSDTNAAGQATFTYTNDGTAGTDMIQANIGNLVSNIVQKTWMAPCQTAADCDDGDACTADACDTEAGRCTHTAIPNCERCNNCIDDDGDGLVDYEDPDCCNQAANLEVFRGSFKGLAKKGKGRLRLRSRLGAIGITEQSPMTDDTTIQFRNANGELLCATVEHQHWMRMHHDTKFWDRSGRLAKGLQDGTIKTKKDGTVIFRTFSNIMDLSSYNKPQMQVTVRVGNKCSRGSVLLRQQKGKLIFP